MKKPDPNERPAGSLEWKAVKGCDRKKPYADKLEATREQALMEGSYPGEKYNAYQCQFCGKWHIGHMRR